MTTPTSHTHLGGCYVTDLVRGSSHIRCISPGTSCIWGGMVTKFNLIGRINLVPFEAGEGLHSGQQVTQGYIDLN